jgi:NTE family protein
MTQSSRRNFLKTSVGAATVVAGTQSFAQSTTLSKKSITEVQAYEAKLDIETTANWNDGLAHPIPYKNPPGKGKERGIALGGGGTPLLGFYAGYFNALRKNGVDLGNADVIVGTSAGSIFGSMLTGGRLWLIIDEMDFFNDFPKLFAELVPALQFNDSQKRAMATALSAKDGSPATIQRIGKAAMASLNPNGVDKQYKVVEKIIAMTKWPSPAMYTTTIDCFTGERLVVSYKDDVPINVAASASSSAPGQVGPTFVKNRICMDGGIFQTSTHSDVIAGVKRALVFSLGDGTKNEQKQGLRLSDLPNTVNQEVKDLEAAGTKTMHIIAGIPPGITRVENLVDPKWIGAYLKLGWDRGVADAPKMKAFWS